MLNKLTSYINNLFKGGKIMDTIKPCQNDFGGGRKFNYELKDEDEKGIGLFHTGHDYICYQSALVYALGDAEIIYNSQVNGYGGYPNIPGGVLWLLFKDKYGKQHLAQYGHVESHLNIGDKIKRGESFGKVHSYFTGGVNIPHLHLSILFNTTTLPEFPWGYVDDTLEAGYTDPIKFIKEFC